MRGACVWLFSSAVTRISSLLVVCCPSSYANTGFCRCTANHIPKMIQIESEEAFSMYFFCKSYLSCGLQDQGTAGG